MCSKHVFYRGQWQFFMIHNCVCTNHLKNSEQCQLLMHAHVCRFWKIKFLLYMCYLILSADLFRSIAFKSPHVCYLDMAVNSDLVLW